MSTISLVLLLFLAHLTILTAQPPVLRYSLCLNRGNYTDTSTNQNSFNITVSEITSNTDNEYGFYNLSHGQTPDRVSLIGLCIEAMSSPTNVAVASTMPPFLSPKFP
ncbi:hypothetical protein K1719_001482 [Acacia pycnantha]|nr:hypothetical protein K1719_001482 [Acacia pycnantha]